MKTFAILILMTIAISVQSSTLEVDCNLSNGGKTYQILVEKPLEGQKQIGIFAYVLTSENWSETYIGPEWNGSLGNGWYTQVAYGIGYETVDGSSFRHGGWIWAGNGKISAIALYENGASGPWGKMEVKYSINQKFTLGLARRSYSGSGLVAEYKLGKSVSAKLTIYNEPELALVTSF